MDDRDGTRRTTSSPQGTREGSEIVSSSVHGLHHVTAIAADPRENLDFYTRVLGLRLVKQTVNQDVPDTYHLFYADGEGTPGTDLTFFPWPRLGPGREGAGLAVEIPLAVPAGSLGYWDDRLGENAVDRAPIEERFGERTLPFRDPHGLGLALVETSDERDWVSWEESPVPPSRQIRGLHAARPKVRDLGPTRTLLEEVLGFEQAGEEAGWHRFGADGGSSGGWIDVAEAPGGPRGAWGTGAVHHVAWRVRDAAEQDVLRARLERAGLSPTPPIDRFWFRSVYFKEPGGVLFELATEGPGFAVDETVERLGERLVLPPWLEARREEIEAALPPLDTPAPASVRGETGRSR